ncbi:thiolase family protein [Microbacterium sp. NPDC055683]
MTASFVYDAVRTPFGRAGGRLSGVRPDDLAAVVMRAAIARTGVDPGRIGDVIFGDANQAGEDNRNVARFGALLAGLPTSVTGTTVNRLCASSLEAVFQASRAVESGDMALALAGGVESMSRSPWVVEKSAKAFPAVGNQTLWNTAIGWRMVNPRLPDDWTISNGEAAERTARLAGISREDQDAFALRSHELSARGWRDGVFDDEIVQVPGAELERDEGVRDGVSIERLGALAPLFAEGGSVTAGNSSSINDGASAVLIGAEGALPQEPLARIAGRGWHGVDPQDFPTAPIAAADKALARAGRTWVDVDVVELNEAFASQALACIAGWPELDPSRVNVHGGALAMGHPLGASGGRVVAHAAHELRRRGGGLAVAALCIGVGQGLAVVLER